MQQIYASRPEARVALKVSPYRGKSCIQSAATRSTLSLSDDADGIMLSLA